MRPPRWGVVLIGCASRPLRPQGRKGLDPGPADRRRAAVGGKAALCAGSAAPTPTAPLLPLAVVLTGIGSPPEAQTFIREGEASTLESEPQPRNDRTADCSSGLEFHQGWLGNVRSLARINIRPMQNAPCRPTLLRAQ